MPMLYIHASCMPTSKYYVLYTILYFYTILFHNASYSKASYRYRYCMGLLLNTTCHSHLYCMGGIYDYDC